jgi:hypothetical protein
VAIKVEQPTGIVSIAEAATGVAVTVVAAINNAGDRAILLERRTRLNWPAAADLRSDATGI